MNKSCRFCGHPLNHIFADLGATPISTAYLPDESFMAEKIFPLRVHVCERCKLVQAEEYEAPENIFSEDRKSVV